MAVRSYILYWGANSYGQLCCGNKEDVLCPAKTVPSPTQDVVLLSGGGGHTILLSKNGELYSCGWNNKGQLGLNDTSDRLTLAHVSSIPAVRTVACGWNHTMAITAEGSLFVFGCNAFGQLGLENVIGNQPSPTPCQVSVGLAVVDVAAGLRHSLAVLADGSVWSWGDNKKGQLGIPGLKTKTVPQPTKVSSLEGRFSQVVAGSHHSAALKENGKVFCWGSNQRGQCGRPVSDGNTFEEPQLIYGDLSDEKVTSILSGWSHLFAKTENNQMFGWGRADYGQLGLGEDVVKHGYMCQPTRILSLDGITQVMCGAEHNIALHENGHVLTWGWNEHGICGSEDERNVHEPRPLPVDKNKDVILVGCGGGHTFILFKSR